MAQAISHTRMSSSKPANVHSWERVLSDIGGFLLIGRGLRRGGVGGLVWGGLGAALLKRGLSGHCDLYQALGMSTNGKASKIGSRHQAQSGIHVLESVRIERPANEVYLFWRKLDTLPQFLEHLESVTVTSSTRSHWSAKGPVGTSVEWDAEIVEDRPSHHIAWESVGNTMVPNKGSVAFLPVDNGRATEVKVSLRYDPPAGVVGAAFARLFGNEPSQQIRNDLQHLKRILESRREAVHHAPAM